MAKLRISLGVEIPNANFEAKTDGAGQVGYADGWFPTSAFTSDITTKLWLPKQIGGVGIYDLPQNDIGHVQYFKQVGSLGANSSRYVESSRSRAGQFFGAEQMVASNYWKYRVRWSYRLITAGGGTPATGAWVIRPVVSDGGANSATFSFQVPSADWNQGWLAKDFTFVLDNGVAWAPAVGNPDSIKIRIICVTGTTAVTNEVLFGPFTIECLGPIDIGTNAATTLHPAATQDTYYELSRAPDWPALWQPVRMGLGALTRLASGAQRYFDPSGGILRRKWEFNQRLLRRTDYRKLSLLWDANRGYSANAGSAFGAPLPLVLIPNQPDDIGSYYVNFTDKDFPISHDTDFQGALDTDQIYKGTLRFEER